MATSNPKALLNRLLEEAAESEWLEFKHNNSSPEEIAQCVSACSNAAMLAAKDWAFIIWGIENKTKKKLGTTFQLNSAKKGGENLTNWLARVIEPRLMMEFLDFTDGGKRFSILAIEPSYDRPIRFGDVEYIRIGENVKKLRDFKEHERALWLATGRRKFEGAIALPHQSATQVLDKLDVETLYRLSREEKPQNDEEIIRKLCASEFIKEDMEGAFDITNLGAILFAKDIGAFPSIAGKSIRVVKYVGLDKRKSENETEGRNGLHPVWLTPA